MSRAADTDKFIKHAAGRRWEPLQMFFVPVLAASDEFPLGLRKKMENKSLEYKLKSQKKILLRILFRNPRGGGGSWL